MRLMSLVEGTVMALDQLRANKSRSFLTILGIVVGVAVVMAMSAMIAGVRTSIISAVMQGGPQNFVIFRFDVNAPRKADAHGPPWGRNPPVTELEARRVARVEGVAAAIPQVPARSGEMTYEGQRVPNVQVVGEGEAWMRVSGGTLIEGRNFLPLDVDASRPLAVITPQLATDVFGQLDPVGRRVRISGQMFEVVGVYKPAESIFSAAQKHVAIVPYTAAIKYLSSNRDFLNITVRPADDASPVEVMDRVTTLLRTLRGLRPGQPNNFALIKMEAFVSLFNRLTAVFFIVMIALSSIGLMVGGVGVIAIMMIAVTERTREIGIRKALGATQREILFQFLIEAVTVTCIGAAIGMAAGATIAFSVAHFTPIPARVPLYAVVAALGMAAVAGVAFGLWPAWRAARMDPVVALRYE